MISVETFVLTCILRIAPGQLSNLDLKKIWIGVIF